MSADF